MRLTSGLIKLHDPILAKPETSRPIIASLTARALLAFAIGSYLLLFISWTLQNHYTFGTFGFDLGIFDQGVWLLSQFKEPFITVMGTHLFGDHTSFILILLVPLYWIWPSVNVLLVVQCLVLGMAAIPAFLLGRWMLRNEWLALCVAIAYLLQPVVAYTNLEQFHPDAFEIPLVLFVFYFMVRGRWKMFLGCVITLLLVKEDVALFTLPLGVYVAMRYNRWIGFLTAGISLAYFILVVLVILPGFNHVGNLDVYRIPFGGLSGLIKTTFTHPWEVVSLAFGPDKPLYLLQLLLPLALLPLGSMVVFTAVGPLLSNLLSNFPYQHWIQYHYATLIVPTLIVSAVFTLSKIPRGLTRILPAVALVVASLGGQYYWGPSPWSRVPAPLVREPSPSINEFRTATFLIPPDAHLATFYRFVPHLSHREQIYEFPNPWRATYWFDSRHDGQRLPEADQVEFVLLSPGQEDPVDLSLIPLLRDEGFITIYESSSLLLMKRLPRLIP